MFDNNAMLGKIKALLNKAEANGTTPEEAEALSAKASELMAKYSIDLALVDAARSKSEREKPAQHTESFAGQSYGLRKLMLLHFIAKAHGCLDIRIAADKLVIFGFQSDIDLSVMLYASLLVQAERALAKAHVPRGRTRAASARPGGRPTPTACTPGWRKPRPRSRQKSASRALRSCCAAATWRSSLRMRMRSPTGAPRASATGVRALATTRVRPQATAPTSADRGSAHDRPPHCTKQDPANV